MRDTKYGKAREMLAVALGNMKDPRAIAVLIDLLADAALVGHAVMGLGKLKAPAAREHLQALTQHSEEWIRQEAKKALRGMKSPLH